MSVDELLVKNGIEDGCDVHWHGQLPHIHIKECACHVETNHEAQTDAQIIRFPAQILAWQLEFPRLSALLTIS